MPYHKEEKMMGSKMSYKKGYDQGDMKPYVENIQKPEKCYSQRYDQSPLDYIERQDKRMGNEGSKLRSESYTKGRY